MQIFDAGYSKILKCLFLVVHNGVHREMKLYGYIQPYVYANMRLWVRACVRVFVCVSVCIKA